MAVHIDLALCGEGDKLVAAIEVVGRPYYGGRPDFDAVAQRLFALTSTEWVCITDSREYQLFSRDGHCSTRCEPPRPADLGLSNMMPQSELAQTVQFALRPTSCDALCSIMSEHRPRSVIVDFTLPWGHRIPESSTLRDLLPVASIEQVPRSLESNQILLAWLASVEWVRWISAVTQPSMAWAAGTRWLRTWLASRLGLVAHIELPVGTFAPATQIAGSYFLLGGHRRTSYFDSLKNPGDLVSLNSSPWFVGYQSWLRGSAASPGYDKPSEVLESWAVAANDPQAEQTRERLSRLGDIVLLGEVCDIFIGVQVSRSELTTDPQAGAVLIIDSRQVRAVPDDTAELRYLPSEYEVRDRDRLQPGDVLLPRVFTQSSRAIVYYGDQPAVAGNTVIVIRPNEDGMLPEQMAEFLNSAAARRLLQSISAGTAVPHISISLLRELPIPRLDIDLGALAEVGEIHGRLLTRAEELESRRHALFDSKDARDFHTKLNDLRWRAGLVSNTLELTESLDFQISQFFPFPLAYSYRLLASCVEPFRLYQEQLRVAENLLAFVGSTSLALLDMDDRRGLRERLKDAWRGGISPGNWRELAARSAGCLGQYEGNLLAHHVSRLNAGSDKKGLGRELQFLVAAKNDFKHDRGPKVEQDVIEHSRELQRSLGRCMEMLAFWTRHPIRQVLDLDVVRRQPGRMRLTCLRIVGDHPGFRQEEVVWHEALIKRDLYVAVEKQYWVSLFPFIQVLTCPRCKAEETYFIDKWNTDEGIVTMKSFERGHTEDSRETAAELLRSLTGDT